MNYYRRKLYALLHAPEVPSWGSDLYQSLNCFSDADKTVLKDWWNQQVDNPQTQLARRIAASSDRVNLPSHACAIEVCHPISGQKQSIQEVNGVDRAAIPDEIRQETDARQVFWWFWRFYPELFMQADHNALLFPAHAILPDCPLHSYQSTVSALVGAMFPENQPPHQDATEPETPYLLLFSFSPVQEFIKASRKFVDFWAGSYLLHYLSAKLCWHIAQKYGPDAIIVPSLWSQEIIDALLVQEFPAFKTLFTQVGDGKTPAQRFANRLSTSLSTAGFPNMITAIVPGKAAAQELGQKLAEELSQTWLNLGQQVRGHIRDRTIQTIEKLTPADKVELWNELGIAEQDWAAYEQDLDLWLKASCWEWGPLWDAQLNNTWEPYWTAIPLGKPGEPLEIRRSDQATTDRATFDQTWLQHQQHIAQAELDLPAQAELAFPTLNVGTWWGSIQQRLRITLQAVKQTRNWQIPTAPGERSTLSGQFTAVHPRLNYTKFAEGGGLPEGSMRLFARVLAKAYPGLFNGSERLNALKLTKRMAWIYGGVAESLSIKSAKRILAHPKLLARLQTKQGERLLSEKFLRFPNLSSIAAARFIHDNPELVKSYWDALYDLIPAGHQRLFKQLTRRASQIPKTDAVINPYRHHRKDYNGVMFSSRWLAEDLGWLKDDAVQLRKWVEKVHQDREFRSGSPADWWAIVLADGDGMGGYVSGHKLKDYEAYLNLAALDPATPHLAELKKTQKRMGPATHVGLNRALLDFSNRLVPYLTEQRFCGRVIYSGGDDVMAVLPIEDLPEYLLSLQSAWSAGDDHYPDPDITFESEGGYWKPQFHNSQARNKLPNRPLFTMGKTATLSMGIVIAHKSVPLPTVLENLWVAEKDRAKEISGKDGLCFRVIYSSGNQLEALMKGTLLADWWHWIEAYLKEWRDQYNTNPNHRESLSPLLHRLSEELPHRALLKDHEHLVSKVAQVIMHRREDVRGNGLGDGLDNEIPAYVAAITRWLNDWEEWAWQLRINAKGNAHASDEENVPLGSSLKELGELLRFTAFWIDRRVERYQWGTSQKVESVQSGEGAE